MDEDLLQKYGKDYLLAYEKTMKEGLILAAIAYPICVMLLGGFESENFLVAIFGSILTICFYAVPVGLTRQYKAMRRKIFEEEDKKICMHCGNKPFESDDS